MDIEDYDNTEPMIDLDLENSTLDFDFDMDGITDPLDIDAAFSDSDTRGNGSNVDDNDIGAPSAQQQHQQQFPLRTSSNEDVQVVPMMGSPPDDDDDAWVSLTLASTHDVKTLPKMHGGVSVKLLDNIDGGAKERHGATGVRTTVTACKTASQLTRKRKRAMPAEDKRVMKLLGLTAEQVKDLSKKEWEQRMKRLPSGDQDHARKLRRKVKCSGYTSESREREKERIDLLKRENTWLKQEMSSLRVALTQAGGGPWVSSSPCPTCDGASVNCTTCATPPDDDGFPTLDAM